MYRDKLKGWRSRLLNVSFRQALALAEEIIAFARNDDVLRSSAWQVYRTCQPLKVGKASDVQMRQARDAVRQLAVFLDQKLGVRGEQAWAIDQRPAVSGSPSTDSGRSQF